MSASTAPTFRWPSTGTGWETLPEQVREQIVACGVRHWRQVHQNVPSYNENWRPLRPVIMTSSTFAALHEVSVRVAGLILQACRRRAGTAGELRRALGVPAGRIRLLDEDEPLTEELLISGRPDVLFSGGVPKFVEFNIDGALGGAFDSDNLAANFAAAYRAEGIDEAAGLSRPPSAVDGRLRTIARWLEPDDDRRVVMVSDWSVGHAGPADQREFLNFLKPVTERATLAGFELVPYWLDWLDGDEQGRLLVDGRPFRSVLRMFVPDVAPPGHGVDALERAVRAGTVRCFTSSASWLLTNKLTLAWLWEDLPQLSEADRELVRAHIPVTVLLTPDRVAEAVARRTELVLKPTDGSSGRDVLLGREADPEEWAAALDRACAGGGFLLQDLVVGDLLPMDFIHISTGEVVTQGVPCCFGPYQFGGEQCGGEVRMGFPGGGFVMNVAHGALVDGFALVEG